MKFYMIFILLFITFTAFSDSLELNDFNLLVEQTEENKIKSYGITKKTSFAPDAYWFDVIHYLPLISIADFKYSRLYNSHTQFITYQYKRQSIQDRAPPKIIYI
jgi:hypothetical protein